MKVIDSKIIDSGYDNFNRMRELDQNLAEASVKALSKNTFRKHIFDYSLNKRMDRGTLLAVALAIKDFIASIPDERIGIALPSGIPGVLVNLAVQMAGKVSVNLNFTMGSDAAKACIRRAKINTVIGAGSVVTKAIPPFTLAYGNPARCIREIDERDRILTECP